MRKSRHIEEKTHGVEVEGDGCGRFWRMVGKMGFRSWGWGSIIALISL
jgi:hypothetical protein